MKIFIWDETGKPFEALTSDNTIEYNLNRNISCTRWFLNDVLHRTDGPAVIFSYGYREWWINGKQVDEF